jgi:hypothetical protein
VTLRQRIVFRVWVLFVAVMGMFPPWTSGPVGGNIFNFGCRFIFTTGYGRIDISRLFVEWAIATAVAAGFYFAWPLEKK